MKNKISLVDESNAFSSRKDISYCMGGLTENAKHE